jgi:uncharacterized protein YuzE
MKNNLNICYDKEADFLELRIGKPTPSYYEDSGDDVFTRIDERTKEIKGFAIFNFKKRTKSLKKVEVSLPAEVKISI